MKNIVVEIISQTASFRNPDFQNFHKSLDLPPPTTVIGLTGAALGLSPPKSQEYIDSNKVRAGVYGYYMGKCSDTWKYNKEIRDMRSYDPGKDGSIIQREMLIQNHFMIAFSSQSGEVVEAIMKGFENPVYALTMGNSDSLAFIKNIIISAPEESSYEIENCILKGDVINDVINLSPDQLEFSIYQTSEPLTYDLPVRFHYTQDYGRRNISEINSFSFIGRKMKLNYKVDGLRCNYKFIPLFDL